ncbi:DUF4435 domain-containing protein [Burkholderia ubonensis]|uniref:DUF4435 domain-containing protein n=1 Tax=Burkholderia ubonensis TaxID=101571 RepID=UPI0009B51EB6|nr:DUF4435 domain-containing protein [Burkholderia ubonensis]
MGMLEEHNAASETEEEIYHEFLLWYKKDRKEVYAIIEGDEDPIFYRGIIDALLPAGWSVRTISAGNKDRVIDTLKAFDWNRFPPARVGFFVDRDLSIFLGGEISAEHSNLYTTDKYSIENELANEQTLLRSLREVMGVTQISSDEEDAIADTYHRNFNTFSEAFSMIMSQIIAWMRANKSPCLKNIDPSVMFRFSDGVLQLKTEFLSDRARIEYASGRVREWPDEQPALETILEDFRRQDGPRAFVRGKYVFWFFTKSILEFHSNITKYCPVYTEPPKIRVALGPKNAMAVLAGKARCWDSLRHFLEANFVSYATTHS